MNDMSKSNPILQIFKYMPITLEGMQSHLLEVIHENPQGISEYDLLKTLAVRDISMFEGDYFNNPHGLYQRHFLLFHCLYLLRDSLRISQKCDLLIHCLCIRRIPYTDVSSAQPALPDPLASYYLNKENLKSTGEQDVLQMLDEFWKKYAGNEKRDEALAVMSLTQPTSYSVIERQYRRLAMQWHPDRGGEPEQFQRLEWAMGVLRPLYR